MSRALSTLTMLIWVVVTVRSVFPMNGATSAAAAAGQWDVLTAIFESFVHADQTAVVECAQTLASVAVAPAVHLQPQFCH
ncbi:hypothetical protein M3Y99_00242000 [Aphelenchoides fujianensis]|nr:hypothetical protein M3Y99_00242000 [Aphelenchoides fujianensis]